MASTSFLERFKKRKLEVSVLVIVIAAAVFFSISSKPENPYSRAYENNVEMREQALGDSYSKARMSNEGMMLAAVAPEAPMAMMADAGFAPMPSESTPAAPSERKIEERHYVEMYGPNPRIKEIYDLASKMCQPAFCDVTYGNFSDGESQSVGSLTMRIENDKVDSYLEGLMKGTEGLSIISKNRTSNDRTSEFADIQARLKSQKVLRERLEQLVSEYMQADVASLLEIERELARVQGTIESMEAQIRSINYVTDRATLDLVLRGKIETAPVVYESPVVRALNSSWRLIEESSAKIILIGASTAPWLALAVVLWIIGKTIGVIRSNLRKRKL